MRTPAIPPLHLTAKAISNHEFADALRATCPPIFTHPDHVVRNPPRRVALAVSGGVDSMALAFLCARLRRSAQHIECADNPLASFTATIVDHRLRPGSAAEALAVQAALLAPPLKMKSRVVELPWRDTIGKDVDPNSLPNIETVARQLRYRAIGASCTNHGIVSLFTAHHSDDQYETVLMRLMSGHRYRGLQGIRPQTDIPECYGMHGIHQSGLVDDQLGPHPFHNTAPNCWDRNRLRRHFQNAVDPHRQIVEMRLGVRPNIYTDRDMDNPARRGRYVPPLGPMPIEAGGVQVYRPLLGFGKDRLIQTCLENGIQWFEDPTNADPSLTLRNAVRAMSRTRTLPVALQKPSILRLSEVCRQRGLDEEAEASRFLPRVHLHDFEPKVGTALIELPPFPLPRSPHRFQTSVYRRQKRIEHCRRIAGLVLRRLMSLVTPERDFTPLGSLDRLVSLLFPSLAPRHERSRPPKAYTISGVHFVPQGGGAEPVRWQLSRAPYVSRAPLPAVEQRALALPVRVFHHPSTWKMPAPGQWNLFDGRWWFRIANRLPVRLRVAPFQPQHHKEFRDGLADDEASEELAAMLRRYAPGKIRYTIPALYAVGADIRALMKGADHWPTNVLDLYRAGFADRMGSPEARSAPKKPTEPADDELARDGRLSKATMQKIMVVWERDVFVDPAKQYLIALPTLGIGLPGLEDWVRWAFRYRKVDAELLRLSRPTGSCGKLEWPAPWSRDRFDARYRWLVRANRARRRRREKKREGDGKYCIYDYEYA